MKYAAFEEQVISNLIPRRKRIVISTGEASHLATLPEKMKK